MNVDNNRMIPLISVIIPVYKAEKYLRESVESVLHQTYGRVEIILVDDGSPDSCPQICDAYAEEDERVKVFHKVNGGVSSARNMGLDQAKGEYVTFLDADDALKPDAMETLYFALKDHGCDISIGWKTCVTENGKELGCPYKMESAIWEGTEGLENSLKDHPACYAVWGKLYKRTIIENIRFVEGKKVHEDSFFFFQCLAKKPRICLCESIVLNYRVSANSASRSAFSDKFLDILFFADEKKKIVEEQFPDLIEIAENMTVRANIAFLSNLLKTKEKKYKKAEKQCIRTIINKKKYYLAGHSVEDRMFFVVTHYLYRVYKWLYRLKKRILAF